MPLLEAVAHKHCEGEVGVEGECLITLGCFGLGCLESDCQAGAGRDEDDSRRSLGLFGVSWGEYCLLRDNIYFMTERGLARLLWFRSLGGVV